MKNIAASLEKMKEYDLLIKQSGGQELKMLMARLPEPDGLRMVKMALMLAVVALCILLSVVMPQLEMWNAIFFFAGWPNYAVLAGVIPSSIVFSFLLIMLFWGITKGFYLALKGFVILTGCVVFLAVGYFIYAMGLLLDDTFYDANSAYLITSVLGLVLSVIAFCCLNSVWFFQSVPDLLYCRAWRKFIVLRSKRARENSP